MNFIGKIRIGELTHKAPQGSHGRRVNLTIKAAQNALLSLIGMPLRMGHYTDAHSKVVGVITSAAVVENDLVLRGHGQELPREGYGLSWEIHDCVIADIYASAWEVESISRFSGVALVKGAASSSSWEIW
jgi:hypothetical protein